MTTGSSIEDTRVYDNFYSGYLPTGLLRSKNWTGVNQAPFPKRGPTTKKVQKTFPMLVWRHGKQIVYNYKVNDRVYVPDSRPRRVKSKDEHPYSCDWNTIRHVEYFTAYNRSTGDGPLYRDSSAGGQNVGSGGVIPEFTSNNELELLNKLRTAVAGSDFSLGIALAEGREAVSMITNSARRIAGALLSARRGNWDWAARQLVNGSDRAQLRSRRHVVDKTFASNWLQLQYGWLPLLKDAEAGAQFLAHHLNVPRLQVVKVTRRVRKDNPAIASAMPTTVGYEAAFTEARKSIKAILSEKDVATLAGLTDPLSIAWEVTPYSFVVDWFIPIGSWLSARSLNSAISGVYVQSTKRHWGVSGLKSINPAQPFFFAGGNTSGYREGAGVFERKITTTLDVPRPEVKSLSKALSFRHSINAIALLANALSSKLKSSERSL